jgi:lysyl-tRNA synthetase class I
VSTADAFLKASIAVSVLIASASISYYYLRYLPERDAQMESDRKLERARAEYSKQAEQARLANELRDADARRAAEQRDADERQDAAREAIQVRYRGCLRVAESNYSANWAQACKRISDDASKNYKDCLAIGGTMKASCDSTYANRTSSPNCSLPRVIATDIGDEMDKAKKRCLEESRAGLQ